MSAESLQQALDHYQNGETQLALKEMQEVLISEPQNPVVRIEYANILMREKRFEDAQELLESLSIEDKKHPSALALFSQLESINVIIDAPDIDDLLILIEKEPDNFLHKEQLIAHYNLRGDYPAAMDLLLYIVRTDRNYKDDYGRTELLKTFELLANNPEMVDQYRRKLAKTLY